MLTQKSKQGKLLKEFQFLSKVQLINKAMEKAVKGGAGKADIID